MSANIAVKYLLENNKNINLIPAKPSSGRGKLDFRITSKEDLLKDKNLLIVDLNMIKL